MDLYLKLIDAVSIPSNIAEGCSRTSQKDFSDLQISLGSALN
jgi:four helix bundle protein